MLKTLVRVGFARGIGGSRGWLALGVVAGGLRMLRKMAKRQADIVYREELYPGQTVSIQHFPRAD
jgi:hypothetical protein